MAKMHPPRFPYPQDPMRKAERRFFDACREQLGDDWIVLYEQRWMGHRNGKKQSGEADFILLSARCGAFVVEVKGGQEIGVDEGDWYSVPHGETLRNGIRNPFTQAADSKHVLWDFISKNGKRKLSGELGHMVVFPGHRQIGDLSPQARRELICDRDDMRDLPATMERVARYFGQRTVWTQAEVEIVAEMLMPSFKLIGEESPHLDDFVDQLDRLTDQQLTAFAMLRNLDRLNVHGGAGTGKTILAFHRAVELALQGARVIYLCHSQPLARYLRDQRDERSDSATGALQMFSEIEFLSHIYPDGPPVSGDFWDLVPDRCLELVEDAAFRCDALIVDEAQSVRESVAEGADLLLEDDGLRYIFGDPNQATIPLGSSALGKFGMSKPIELNVNCRSSAEIAKYAHSLVDVRIGAIGEAFAEVQEIATEIQSQSSSIAEVVRSWMHRFGLGPAEIKILVPSGAVRQGLLLGEGSPIDNLGMSVEPDLAIDWLTDNREYLTGDFDEERERIAEFLEQSTSAPKTATERVHAYSRWLSSAGASLRPGLIGSLLVADGGTETARRMVDGAREKWTARTQDLESLGRPVFGCIGYQEFIGLEAHAVVGVLPIQDPGESDEDFMERLSIIAYTMSTRARALLALVGEPVVIEFLKRVRERP